VFHVLSRVASQDFRPTELGCTVLGKRDCCISTVDPTTFFFPERTSFYLVGLLALLFYLDVQNEWSRQDKLHAAHRSSACKAARRLKRRLALLFAKRVITRAVPNS
jgi:hypothetical protein